MTNRFALGVLAASATLAAVMLLLPRFGLASLAPWMAALGLAGYLGMVATVKWPTSVPRELGQVRAVRRSIAERLAVRRAGDGAFAAILADALWHVDTQLLPALERAVA